MIASLPMYDRPEIRAETDMLWAAVRARLDAGPADLDRDLGLWDMWEHPELVLSQTCGLPLATRLWERVTYVASPDMRLSGAPAGYYNSVLLARAADDRELGALAQARVCINQSHSQSGHGALVNHFDALGLPLGPRTETGGHVLTAKAIADNVYDLGCVDAQSWRLIQRYDPWAKQLRVVSRTQPTPATPYITRLGADGPALASALAQGIDDIGPDLRETLGLFGICTIPLEAYRAVPQPQQAQTAA